jgi:hypothetical protein
MKRWTINWVFSAKRKTIDVERVTINSLELKDLIGMLLG